jgi:hypothetical protein
MAKDAKKPDGLEGKVDEGLPNLEEIATRLANMEENHKMNQILPSVMDAFVNYKDVKYNDTRGVEHYHTQFTAAQAKGIAEAVFDKLCYHVHLRRYGDMTPDFFDQLKKLKDPDGNPLADAEVHRALGITKADLIKMVIKNKDDLTTDHFSSLVKEILEHHVEYVAKNVTSPIGEEHKDHLMAFIDKYKTEKGLKGKEYKLDKNATFREIMPVYQKIAANYFKKDVAPEPKEEKKKSV